MCSSTGTTVLIKFKAYQERFSPVVATVIQPFDSAVDKVVDLIKKLVIQKKTEKEAIGEVKVIYMDTPLVTSANVDEYLK